tara:strand:- start:396 stop:533 length:138 start_codon:yes stop_codon:yes gene_type:complete
MWLYDMIEVLRFEIIKAPFTMGFFIFVLGVGVGQLFDAICDYLND